jgi:uncharacterized protein (TIGR03435 family)
MLQTLMPLSAIPFEKSIVPPTRRAWRRSDLGRTLLLGVGIVLAGVIGVAKPMDAWAQAAAPQKPSIEGAWQGTLHIPQRDLRIVLKVSKNAAGALTALNYSIDQGGQPIPVSKITFQDSELKFSVEALDGTYDGKMSADGDSIAGQWTQGQSLALVFERATPDTEWAIPEPPPKLASMPADANPTFEVATIKPSKPDAPGKMFGVNGARFTTLNTTLGDLIKFAYDIQDKQILNGPPWLETDKFDIAAQPDIPGTFTDKQLKSMVQKLLTDRFQLKFHKDTKELSAYVLTVSKSGSKLKKSQGDPSGLPGLWFRGLGVLTVTNATMGDFCHLMQSAVLDRPVVDQTGLAGRWDFLLKWTPDESQFAGMGVKVPPPTDAADAPPPLFTALQEQIGLKLDAGKAPVGVLVLDHVEKPSGN